MKNYFITMGMLVLLFSSLNCMDIEKGVGDRTMPEIQCDLCEDHLSLKYPENIFFKYENLFLVHLECLIKKSDGEIKDSKYSSQLTRLKKNIPSCSQICKKNFNNSGSESNTVSFSREIFFNKLKEYAFNQNILCGCVDNDDYTSRLAATVFANFIYLLFSPLIPLILNEATDIHIPLSVGLFCYLGVPICSLGRVLVAKNLHQSKKDMSELYDFFQSDEDGVFVFKFDPANIGQFDLQKFKNIADLKDSIEKVKSPKC